MAMQMATLSQATLDEAHQMALQSHTWSRGRSRANDRQFWVIPSRTEEGVAHWVTSFGCTCKGARRRGNCAHAEAVRMVEARERATARSRYDELWPAEDDGTLTSAF